MAIAEKNLTEKKIDRDGVTDIVVFLLLLAVAAAAMFVLFYHQCVENVRDPNGLYYADMRAYILEMQGIGTKYSYPYPVFFKLSAFLHLFVGAELAVAMATTLLNCLAIVIVKWALNKMTLASLRGAYPGLGALGGVLISVVSVGLFFLSMLYPPRGIYLPGIRYKYLGVFTANPFHNATYMAARPFAILAFLWFVKLLDVYGKIPEDAAGKRTLVTDHILFSFFLLAATMTKPSFTIVMVGAAGLIMAWRLVSSRFQNLKATVLLGLTFIPTFIDLLYQFNGVFVPQEGAEGGIGFCFGRIWGLYCDNIPLGIGLAMGFPILVLLVNWKEIKTDTFYRFSWQIYVMGFVMTFFLYEKGFRDVDFNFSWGYMYGIFFAFLGSLAVLIRTTAGRRRPLLLVVQWLAFLWHLTCGLLYFYELSLGGSYY